MSKFLSIGSADILKGFIMAVITVLVTGLYTALTATPPHFPAGSEWTALGLSGLAAGVAYLIKNLLTNSTGQFLKTEA